MNSAKTLVAIDPGHFHAALAQKTMPGGVSPVAYVFAPDGPELDAHLRLVDGFNARTDSPTAWRENVYRGDDFLERFRSAARSGALGENPVVVLAGRNDRKGDYALAAVEAGCSVLADKPLAITQEAFDLAEKAARRAEAKGLQFSDMMTERHVTINAIRRELVADRSLYGDQEKGSTGDPAVVMSSVHHFCKLVDGKPLRRPVWYYDTAVQGEGIADVTVHLVDQAQWTLFPSTRLSEDDVQVLSAESWPTEISPGEFELSTGCRPANTVSVEANGSFTWRLGGVCCRVSVEWNFMAPKGSGDTHCSLMRGTNAELSVRQGAAESYRPTLYVRARRDAAAMDAALACATERLSGRWPGVCAVPAGERGLWRIEVPEGLDPGHEGHFGEVVKEFLTRMDSGRMCGDELANMLVKYRTIVEARNLAHRTRSMPRTKGGAAWQGAVS